MGSAKHVLLVRGDARITELLRIRPRDEGYAMVHATDGHADQREMGRSSWSTPVFDLMLPGIGGPEICRRARTQACYTPIIIINTRSTEVYHILRLEPDADGYLAKPFSVLGLVTRAKALTRRANTLARNTRMESDSLTLDNFEIEPLAREVCVDGEPIELAPREFDLLHLPARRPGKVFSRLDLPNQIQGYQHDGCEHTVSTHTNRLRTKVEVDPVQPRHILTTWGRGYKLSTGASDKKDAT